MLYQYSIFRDLISSASSDDSKHMSMGQKCKQGFSYSSLEAWFSLVHKQKHISTSTFVSKWKLPPHKHERKHQKNGQVCLSLCLTSENGVDISTSISTRPRTNHRSFWPRPHANISKATMADASSAILFIVGLRRAGIENRVKYAIMRVRMFLCLCLCPSENHWNIGAKPKCKAPASHSG